MMNTDPVPRLPVRDGSAPPRTLRQWQAHAEQSLPRGVPWDKLLGEMVATGCPEEQARSVLQTALASQRKAASGLVRWGSIIAAAGVGVSLTTYAFASESGGTYFLWYGPIILGAILVMIGLTRRAKVSLSEPAEAMATKGTEASPKPSASCTWLCDCGELNLNLAERCRACDRRRHRI